MCTTCGCGHEHRRAHTHRNEQENEVSRAPRHTAAHGLRTIRLQQDLLAENDRLASETRHALGELNIGMVNLIGGPGSGKTALLEATIPRVRDDVAIAVLEG